MLEVEDWTSHALCTSLSLSAGQVYNSHCWLSPTQPLLALSMQPLLAFPNTAIVGSSILAIARFPQPSHCWLCYSSHCWLSNTASVGSVIPAIVGFPCPSQFVIPLVVGLLSVCHSFDTSHAMLCSLQLTVASHEAVTGVHACRCPACLSPLASLGALHEVLWLL